MTGTLELGRYSTLRRLATDPDHKLVVAFGGGSLPGLCGNSALAAILEELELRPYVREIWGTSAGAVIGGGWASGASAARIFELVCSLQRPGSFDFSRLRFALAILASLPPLHRPMPDGLVRGRIFRATIDAGLAVKTFEECPIPFRCLACTDDGHATRKVFRSGPLLPAIFASMSIPGIVIPQPFPDGATYYDGGLIEKTPLSSVIAEHLISGDRRKLLLLCTRFAESSPKRAQGFHARFLQTIDALENANWDHQLKEARARHDLVLLVLNPKLSGASMFGFTQARQDYDAAKATFTSALQNAHLATGFAAT